MQGIKLLSSMTAVPPILKICTIIQKWRHFVSRTDSEQGSFQTLLWYALQWDVSKQAYQIEVFFKSHKNMNTLLLWNYPQKIKQVKEQNIIPDCSCQHYNWVVIK